MTGPRVCAVVPAYNEEKHVAEVVRAVINQGIEVLIVDDCSTDATSERAREAGAEVVGHDENRGKGIALATGLGWAAEHGYDAAITLDGDGQHDPAEIPRFLEAAKRGADVVVGSRVSRARDMPSARKVTNWGMSAILSMMAGQKLTDTQSGYRLIRTDAWKTLDLSSSHFDAESEMLVRACRSGMRVLEVPIRTIYGDERSSIHPVRDTLRWLRLLWRLAHKGGRRRASNRASKRAEAAASSGQRRGPDRAASSGERNPPDQTGRENG